MLREVIGKVNFQVAPFIGDLVNLDTALPVDPPSIWFTLNDPCGNLTLLFINASYLIIDAVDRLKYWQEKKPEYCRIAIYNDEREPMVIKEIMKRIPLVLSTLAVLSIFFSNAYANFYVIPTKTKTIIVALSGGDYTSLEEALASITNASMTQHYRIQIKAGTYQLSNAVSMKPYVDIIGAGEAVTILKGALDSALSGLVNGADNANLSNLTVENNHSNTYAISMAIEGVSPTISSVTFKALGATATIGVYVKNASPVMNDVTVISTGFQNSYGISTRSYSSPKLTSSDITVSNGISTNYGIDNENSFTLIKDSNITVTGNGANVDNYGISYYALSSGYNLNVNVSVSGNTQKNIGVSNVDSSSVTLNSTIAATGGATTYGVEGSSNIIDSTIQGGGSNNAVCSNCEDENGQPLNSSCN